MCSFLKAFSPKRLGWQGTRSGQKTQNLIDLFAKIQAKRVRQSCACSFFKAFAPKRLGLQGPSFFKRPRILQISLQKNAKRARQSCICSFIKAFTPKRPWFTETEFFQEAQNSTDFIAKIQAKRARQSCICSFFKSFHFYKIWLIRAQVRSRGLEFYRLLCKNTSQKSKTKLHLFFL